jgi:tripartite-type tricarboxylate transporter receptor subunit TctC
MRKSRLSSFIPTLLLALAAAAPSVAVAQTGFPSKPIKLIVPFASGGAADVVARQIADTWSAKLGQPIIIENQGGGAGVVAVTNVVKSSPDGHTILFAASGNITTQPILNNSEAEIAKLAPVSLISTSPHVLVVTAKLPVTNVKELVAYARANPGHVNFGSPGVGGLGHLGIELFRSSTKTDITHIPYRGGSQVTKDLVSGDVHALFSSLPSLKPFMDAGRIRAIGLTAPSRSADAKGIPTIAEAGFPGVEYTTWYGAYVAGGTPQPVINKLNATLRETFAVKALRDKLDVQGVELQASTPAQLRKLMQDETGKWRKVIKDANITLN